MAKPSRASGVRTRVWSVGRFFILVAALGVTFGAFFLAGLRVTSRAREVEVPNLAGKSIADAKALLAARGLVLRVDEQRRPDKAVPADHVLTQEPASGETVRRTRAIRVRLSDGLRAPAVPTLVGLPERTADITLSGDRVSVGYRAEISSPDYAVDVVVGQDPTADERAEKVNVLINRGSGSQDYVVPDLIGTLGARSADLLRSLKFRIAVTAEVPYPGLPPGIVVKQTPQPGFRIASGETITLEVSR